MFGAGGGVPIIGIGGVPGISHLGTLSPEEAAHLDSIARPELPMRPGHPPRKEIMGHRVTLQGLSKTELNGAVGKVVRFDMASGRYVVELESGVSFKVREPHHNSSLARATSTIT
jgi:hypothetical protein